jgi:hypothetical protein
MADRLHPLEGVRIGNRNHPAPAWPQVEQQYAPTCYVRVPDCPLLDNGSAATAGIRQNWSLGPGWVVGWKATVFAREALIAGGAELWVPSDIAAQFYHVQLEVNGHDHTFTDSEARAWTRLGLMHSLGQGWLPWLVRVEPGDVWSWAHWFTGLATVDKVRAEIALQFVADADLAEQVDGQLPKPTGALALARTLPRRYMIPPVPLPVLSPGQESAARRIDFQQGPGRLVAWCGEAKYHYTYRETEYEGAGLGAAGNCEVQASWHDGEHLVQNGSGPDWISFYTLWGGRGGRRWQPLCRRFSSGDQLTVRMRNIATDNPGIELQPEVVFAWGLDRDLVPRGRG